MNYRLKGHSVEFIFLFEMVARRTDIQRAPSDNTKAVRHELWQEPVRHGSRIFAGTRPGILAGTPASRTPGI